MIDNFITGLYRIPDFTGSITIAMIAWLVLALLLLGRPAREGEPAIFHIYNCIMNAGIVVGIMTIIIMYTKIH